MKTENVATYLNSKPATQEAANTIIPQAKDGDPDYGAYQASNAAQQSTDACKNCPATSPEAKALQHKTAATMHGDAADKAKEAVAAFKAKGDTTSGPAQRAAFDAALHKHMADFHKGMAGGK